MLDFPMFSPLQVVSRRFGPQNRSLHPEMSPGTSSECLQWRHMIRNDTFLCESLGEFILLAKFGDSRHVQLAIQFFTRNPNLQSELTNSFTQRRKLRKTNLRESRFLIVKFLIIRLHRIGSPPPKISPKRPENSPNLPTQTLYPKPPRYLAEKLPLTL